MKYARFLLLIPILLILVGCTFPWQQQADLNVQVDPTRGHPKGDGLLVTVTGYTGTVDIDWDDGTTETVSEVTATHVYNVADVYTITVSKGAAFDQVQVKVTNIRPEIYPPFLMPGHGVGNGEKVAINMAYQIHGCPSSGSAAVYGARDRDGDPLEFRYTIINKFGEAQPVFDKAGANVDGQWITEDTAHWFAGLTAEEPPYPMSCQTSSQSYILIVDVRDPWGGEGFVQESLTVYP